MAPLSLLPAPQSINFKCTQEKDFSYVLFFFTVGKIFLAEKGVMGNGNR